MQIYNITQNYKYFYKYFFSNNFYIFATKLYKMFLTKEYRDYIRDNGLVDKKDFYYISSSTGRSRSHIKNVIENGNTTDEETYNAILDYFKKKVDMLKQQKALINGTSSEPIS